MSARPSLDEHPPDWRGYGIAAVVATVGAIVVACAWALLAILDVLE